MVPELLVLALDFHRAPLLYPHLTDPKTPLPEAFDRLFIDFASAITPQGLERLAQQLAERPAVIDEAARFFLRQALVIPGADHYRVLGLSRGASETMVRQHYRLLIRLFHPDRGDIDPAQDAALSVRINDAYKVLRHEVTRAKYDLQLLDTGFAEALRPDIATLLSPCRVPALVGVAKRARIGSHRTMRSAALWLFAGVVLLAIIWLLVLDALTRPALRSNPDAARASDPKPSYIQGRDLSQMSRAPSADQREPRGGEGRLQSAPRPDRAVARSEIGRDKEEAPVGDRAAAKPVGVERSPQAGILPRSSGAAPIPGQSLTQSGKAAEGATTGAATPAESRSAARSPISRSPISAKEANALVARFSRAYSESDLAGLVALFAAEAIIDGGGVGGIRKDEGGLFGPASSRSMTISRVSWQRLDSDTATGTARVVLTARPGGESAERQFIGSIELELIRSDRGLKIRKLMHRLAQE